MLTEAESTEVLKTHLAAQQQTMPETLIVLGSGWNKLVEAVEVQFELSYQTLFGATSTVPGHDGKFIIAQTPNDQRVALMAGRLHMYEGYTAHESTLPIRVLADAGITSTILTAAVGGLNEDYKVGDFVILSDIISFLLLDRPLKGPQFLDKSEIFDPEWRAQAVALAAESQIPAHEGVYAYFPGPDFESPVEKRAIRSWGADVVGMSTVHEAMAGKWAGMDLLGLAFVTNLAFVKHDHQEVLAEANKGAERMVQLLLGLVK